MNERKRQIFTNTPLAKCWSDLLLLVKSFFVIGLESSLFNVANAAFPSFDFDDERCVDQQIPFCGFGEDLESMLPPVDSFDSASHWERNEDYNGSVKSRDHRAVGKNFGRPQPPSMRKDTAAPLLTSDQIAAVLQKVGFAEEKRKFRLQNVPGDGCCGCWALLLSAAAVEDKPNGRVTRADISALLNWLADDIAAFFAQSSFTEEDLVIFDELTLLIVQYTNAAIDNVTSADRNRFLSMLREGRVQLDSVLIGRLTRHFRRTIIVVYDENNAHVYDYPGDRDPLIIFYRGEGILGHYQSIILEKYILRRGDACDEQSSLMLLEKAVIHS
ncbi:MAG: hypothetical protein LW808_003485 [Verrucomicrobiota bacterium]|nr:MAG: hypothetical protein LW808_003485 [Verrucomicrobiota bacterium]